MTSAVIAKKTNNGDYQYWVIDHNGAPEDLIPVLAFMTRYGRLSLHLHKFSLWHSIHPSINQPDFKPSIKGFGIPYPGTETPTLVDTLEELSNIAEHLYLVDSKNPEIVVHDGTAYDLVSTSTWSNPELRRAYNVMSFDYGY